MFEVKISCILIDYLTSQQLKVLLYCKSIATKYNTFSISITETAKILRMSNHTVASALEHMLELTIIIKQYTARRFRQPDGTYKYQCPQYKLNDSLFAKNLFNGAKKKSNEGVRKRIQKIGRNKNNQNCSAVKN